MSLTTTIWVVLVYDYLKTNLHERNGLLSSTIFSHIPQQILKLAVVKYPWNKTKDTPYLTCVPAHILMMSNMTRFESKLDVLSSELMDGLKEELNRRDIGGGMYHAVQIQEEIRGLRDELSRMRASIPSSRGEGNGDSHGFGSEVEDSRRTRRRRMVTQLYSYDGRFNILPKHFVIPTLTLASFLAFYLIGKPNDGIPPFCLVKPSDLKFSNSGEKVNVKILTDMKCMASHVERAGRELNVWEEDPEAWTPAKVTRLYETVNWNFRIPPARGTQQFEGLSWLTYLAIVKKAKGKLVGDPDSNS